MKYWTYTEPVWDDDGNIVDAVVTTRSEEQILREYYQYWMGQMVEKFGIDEVIRNYTTQDCIDDWVVVNWAWETDERGNPI